MKDIYLHVGMPKAASTFLQQHCLPHLSGVHVVTQKTPYPPDGLIGLLWRVADSYPLFADMDAHKTEIEQFLQRVEDDKVLISSERLVGHHISGFRDHFQVTESLHQLFPSAKIILIIRRQDELLESLYRQVLKQCFTPTVNGFLGYVPKGVVEVDGEQEVEHNFQNWRVQSGAYPSVNVRRLDYYAHVRHYAAVFGRRNVLVLPQEMLRNEPDRFHIELANFMGIEPCFPPPGSKDANRAYSLLSCHIALLLNRFVRHPAHEKRLWRVIPHHPLTPYLRRRTSHDRVYRLLDVLNRRLSLRYMLEEVVDRIYYQRGHLISSEKRRMIMEVHRESNRKLDEEYCIRLREYGYY